MKVQVLATLSVLSVAGCSAPHVVVDAKADRPISAKANHLVTAADEMEDLDAADRLVVLTEEALRRRGYRSNSAEDADIVVITRASHIASSGKEIPLKPAEQPERSMPAALPPGDSFSSVATLAIGSPYGLNLEQFEGPQLGSRDLVGTEEPIERLRVTVKAALTKHWMKPDTTFESLPAIWMVTVEGFAFPSQRAEFLERALDTASTYFAQNTEEPLTRAISLSPPGRSTPLATAVHREPDLTLDPLQ